MTQVILHITTTHLRKYVFKWIIYTVTFKSTGIINLKDSKTHKNKFERGMTDEFTVEAVDIGPLKKLRIGHDNSGMGWKASLRIQCKFSPVQSNV